MPWEKKLNLQNEAQFVNSDIACWLNTTVADKPVNIVMVDWIEYGEIPDVCLQRN